MVKVESHDFTLYYFQKTNLKERQIILKSYRTKIPTWHSMISIPHAYQGLNMTHDTFKPYLGDANFSPKTKVQVQVRFVSHMSDSREINKCFQNANAGWYEAVGFGNWVQAVSFNFEELRILIDVSVFWSVRKAVSFPTDIFACLSACCCFCKIRTNSGTEKKSVFDVSNHQKS